MNEKSFVGQQIMGLLRNARNPFIKNAAKIVGPAVYDNVANVIDTLVDPEKEAMEYYAKEFNPSPERIQNLQNVKDWIGSISDIPMAPPFFGRSELSRGYLPTTNLSRGSDTSGGFGMYDPYPEMARRHNFQMRSYEQSENDAARRPFDDWAKLHSAVAERHRNTIAFQDSLRKDPKIIAAAKGNPKLLAEIIHRKTRERNANSDQVRAGDMLRHTLINEENPDWGSMKPGTTQAHSLDLRDMTGRRPYIIR